MGALGLVHFFTKNPNLKYNIFWGWAVMRGRGSVAMVSDFFTKNPNLKKKIFLRAWGEDGLGK